MPKVAYKLFKRKLGFRDLLNIIPLDASLVKGSHGRIDNPAGQQPVFIGHAAAEEIGADEVCGEILAHLGIEADVRRH
jgi:hypothetical protein